MTDEREILSQKLKNFRTASELNQEEFAEDCGISRELLSLIECGKENFTLDTLQLLAAKIGCSTADLLTDTITYTVTETKKTVEDTTATVYGISASQQGTDVASLDDVSDSRKKVTEIAEILNRNQIAPKHLVAVCEYILDN